LSQEDVAADKNEDEVDKDKDEVGAPEALSPPPPVAGPLLSMLQMKSTHVGFPTQFDLK